MTRYRMGRFYVTTPIYYVNDVPHLGTAYTTIVADALRRFHAAPRRRDAHADGHRRARPEDRARSEGEGRRRPRPSSTRSARASARRGRSSTSTPTTSSARPSRVTRASCRSSGRRSRSNGDLYLGEYEGWYCVGCESLKTEKELEQPGNLCPLHKNAGRAREGEHVLLPAREVRQKPLLDFYEQHPSFIQPESRRNEVHLASCRAGSRISRSRARLLVGHPGAGQSEARHVRVVRRARELPERARHRRARALLGAEREGRAPRRQGHPALPRGVLAGVPDERGSDEELPDDVFAHGFLTVDGQKMCKSLRNAVDPLQLADRSSAARRAPLPPAARHRVRAGRRLRSRGAPRALQRRPRQEPRQPALARASGSARRTTDGKHPDDDVGDRQRGSRRELPRRTTRT